MLRILVLILMAGLFYYVCKRFISYMNDDAANKQKNDPSADSKVAEQSIVKCAHCGTHIPEHESMQLDDKIVCKQQPCQLSHSSDAT